MLKSVLTEEEQNELSEEIGKLIEEKHPDLTPEDRLIALLWTVAGLTGEVSPLRLGFSIWDAIQRSSKEQTKPKETDPKAENTAPHGGEP